MWLRLIDATAPAAALDRALLCEHQVTGGFRMQRQRRSAGNVQHDHILARHCADAHLFTRAALRPDTHRLL